MKIKFKNRTLALYFATGAKPFKGLFTVLRSDDSYRGTGRYFLVALNITSLRRLIFLNVAS